MLFRTSGNSGRGTREARRNHEIIMKKPTSIIACAAALLLPACDGPGSCYTICESYELYRGYLDAHLLFTLIVSDKPDENRFFDPLGIHAAANIDGDFYFAVNGQQHPEYYRVSRKEDRCERVQQLPPEVQLLPIEEFWKQRHSN